MVLLLYICVSQIRSLYKPVHISDSCLVLYYVKFNKIASVIEYIWRLHNIDRNLIRLVYKNL